MSELAIWNMALGLVGAAKADALTDDTLEAEQCDQFYDLARRYCLERREWTFASDFAELTAVALAAPSEFANSFALPADCLAVRAASSVPNMAIPLVYQKDGADLLSDAGEVYIKYTIDETDTDAFSPSFRAAVAHKLAELIAPTLTGDIGLKRSLMVDSEDQLDQGGAIDGMQGSPKTAFASRLIGARYRSGPGSRSIGKYVY